MLSARAACIGLGITAVIRVKLDGEIERGVERGSHGGTKDGNSDRRRHQQTATRMARLQ